MKLSSESDKDGLLKSIEDSLEEHKLTEIDEVDLSDEEKFEGLSKENENLRLRLAMEALRNELQSEGMRDKFGGVVVPGGTLSLSSSSQTGISMIETFDRPLVVGYHALEFVIGPHGLISPTPSSTFARVTGERMPPVSFIPYQGVPSNMGDLDKYYETLTSNQ